MAEERPAREQVLLTEHWRVAHAFDTSLPGWLVALPRRHVETLAELTADEAAEMGPLLAGLSRALQTVTGCAKTYVMLFAEASGFSHLHLHVVPRMPDAPVEQLGPGVFARLGGPPAECVPEAEQDRLAARIRLAAR